MYWALQPTRDLINRLYSRVDKRLSRFQGTWRTNRVLKLYKMYYGEADQSSTGGLLPGGRRGELTMIHVNYLRYLIRQLLSLVTSQRVAFEAIPANTDSSAKKQQVLADGLLEAYVDELDMDTVFRLAAEYSVITGDGFIRVDWDPTIGEDFAVDTVDGGLIRTGDVRMQAFSALEVDFDGTYRRHDQVPWYTVSEPVNKWDLIAQFPEHAEAIKNVQPINSPFVGYSQPGAMQWDKDDTILLHTWYHKRTAAVPEGRQAQFIDGVTLLPDGPLAYKRLPLVHICPSSMLGTPYGYSPAFDSLGLAEALNMRLSIALSNQAAFGVHNIASKKGNNLVASKLTTGMNLVEYTDEKPEVMNFASTSPEIFKSMEMDADFMQASLGQNDASLGQIDRKLSGTAIAELDEKAMQLVSPFTESYVKAAQDSALMVLETVSLYADTPRVKRIAGINGQYTIKAFQGADLEGIIKVKLSNPASHTGAMRREKANFLAERGLITTPDQYFEIEQTGTLKPLLEGPVMKATMIKQEDEQLMAGILPICAPTDNPLDHINSHASVLDNPDVRENADMIMLVQRHIQDHLAMWLETSENNADLLQVLNIPLHPAVMQQLAAPPGGPSGQPSAGPSPAQPKGPPSSPPDTTAPNQTGPKPGPSPELPGGPESQ